SPFRTRSLRSLTSALASASGLASGLASCASALLMRRAPASATTRPSSRMVNQRLSSDMRFPLFRELQLLRAGAVGLPVRDAEVAHDAGDVFRARLGVARARLLGLQLRAHRVRLVAVAALVRVVADHRGPHVLRELVAVLLELLLGVDLAGEVAPDLEARLHLAPEHRRRLARHVAVGAHGAHTRAVDFVDAALELGVDVVAHLVAADAELERVGPREARRPGREEHAADDDGEKQHSRPERHPRAGLAALAQIGPPLADHGRLSATGCTG